MRNFVKNTVMGLLVWMCIIWLCCFDPSQLGHWFKIAGCIFGVTLFWWWIFDFENPFVEDIEEKA